MLLRKNMMKLIANICGISVGKAIQFGVSLFILQKNFTELKNKCSIVKKIFIRGAVCERTKI